MDHDLLQLLKSVDTPTVCNAIEAARAPGFDFETVAQAWDRFEKART